MKKLLVVAVLAACAYGVYWYLQHRAPEKRACARLAELCGDKSDAAHCEHDMIELAKTASPDSMTKLDTCLADAKTCVAGAGCMFGTGMNAFGDALNQFMKGVSNSMNK